MRTGVISIGLGLVLSAGMAFGQIAPPATNPSPATPPASPLSGPTVAPANAAATLVHMDMSTGMVVRVETTPEEAALDLVKLTPEEKAATDTIFAERAAVMDKVVAEHLPLLLKFQGLRQGDSVKERMQALTELARALQPVKDYNTEHGGPLQQISKAIAPEKFAEVQRLVTEYRQALANETEATVKTKEDKPDQRPAALRGREALLAVGNEVRRSYERQTAAKQAALDDLIKKVNATPEQETKLRNLAVDYAQKTVGKPTTAQRRELFEQMFKVLDDKQKMVLLEEIYKK